VEESCFGKIGLRCGKNEYAGLPAERKREAVKWIKPRYRKKERESIIWAWD
jgi:hypothetical protein